MRIERLHLRLIRLPLVAFFETSFGRVYDKTFILVTLEGEGAQGLGECVADVNPYYSSETNTAAWHVIKDFLAPRVLGRPFAHPRRRLSGARARARPQHGEGRAWRWRRGISLRAAQDVPLCAAARRHARAAIAVRRLDRHPGFARAARRESRDELAAGYRRIKIKIKPGWDVDGGRAFRDRFGAIPLMVDANAAYTPGDAAHLARARSRST